MRAADTVSYPEANPVFTIDAPEGWQVKHGHGAVRILAQAADAVLVLQHVDNVKDDDTAAVAVAELATLQGKQFSLADTTVVRPPALGLMGDFKGFITECSGKSRSGMDTSWQVMLFSPKDNDYFVITCLWINDEADKTAADRRAMFKSLKLLK
jgi:hypothetical protein